jgi:hypothetical protein
VDRLLAAGQVVHRLGGDRCDGHYHAAQAAGAIGASLNQLSAKGVQECERR